MSGSPLINLPTYTGNYTHQSFVRGIVIHNILHVSINMARKIMIQESTNTYIFYNKVLLCLTYSIILV